MAFRNPVRALPADSITSGSFGGNYRVPGLFTVGDEGGRRVEVGTNAAGKRGVRLYGPDGTTVLVDLDATAGGVGTIMGGTVIGGTIATDTTGNRVELLGGGNTKGSVLWHTGAAGDLAADARASSYEPPTTATRVPYLQVTGPRRPQTLNFQTGESTLGKAAELILQSGWSSSTGATPVESRAIVEADRTILRNRLEARGVIEALTHFFLTGNLYLTGELVSDVLPLRMASARTSLTIGSATDFVQQTVAFPAGRFSRSPVVVATAQDGNYIAAADQVTTTSFRLTVADRERVIRAGRVQPVDWIAYQHSGSAGGG